MHTATPRAAFWAGFRDCLPFILVAVPFATLFGLLATKAGLNVFEVLTFSFVVTAGAAQLTALSLMQDNAPTLVVLASALAVNLRVAMYSAAITPHLGGVALWKRALAAYMLVDQAYALSVVKYEDAPDWNPATKLAYFFGTCAPILPLWYMFSVVGAVAGQAIPTEWPIAFIMPLTFLSLIGPMLRTPAHLVAAAVASASALVFVWVPYNLGLMIAGTLGMIAGAQVELWLNRGRAS